MKFTSIVLSILQVAAVTLAYSLAEGTISVGDQQVAFGEINTQQIRQLSIDAPKEKIEIQLKLNEALNDKPHQVVVTLGNSEGLETSYVPNFVSDLIKLSIPVGKIPAILKLEDKLFLRLIVADSNPEEKNLLKSLVEIVPTENLKKSVKYTRPTTLGPKPEIHHIFREDASTVNPLVPIVFIGAAAFLFLGLLGSWAVFVGQDLFSVLRQVSGLGVIHHFGFLASLVGFEVTFARYYFGDSIFKTLARGFILGLPSIFFGSKVLASLSAHRKADRV